MSESKPTTPESSETSAGESPRASRTSNVRAKKSAKPQRPKQVASEKPALPSYPVFDLSEHAAKVPETIQEPTISSDWPEPESASSGGAPPQEGAKRKRRRKKGKGGGQQVVVHAMAGDPALATEGDATIAPTPQPRPSQHNRPKVDPEKLAKLALKIYLAEVCEEGVALIGDSDAKELSRRCFRLAEIFIEEESRRR